MRNSISVRVRVISLRADSRRSVAWMTAASSDFGSEITLESFSSRRSTAWTCARSSGSLAWKIPSMRVTDLAEAMAPGLPVDIIGIRPGEKLHEVLITADESRHAIDAGDVYVVLPEHPWWGTSPAWLEGKPLPDGFSYTSDQNDEWLSADELRVVRSGSSPDRSTEAP